MRFILVILRGVGALGMLIGLGFGLGGFLLKCFAERKLR